ncbi:MAG: type ISP restriction/modification enzyme [Thermodesulfobacteriota bacterium]
MLKSYLKKITETSNRGDAREESFYGALSELLDSYAKSTGRKNIHVTTLPKKTEAGNPDFRVWDGNHKQVGYIEAKAPTVTNLDQIEDSEQLKRYIGTFPNVILTNFLEFRLYRNGDLIDQVQIARPVILNKLKAAPPVEKETEFLEFLEKFFSFSLPKLHSAKSLAVELAKRTKFLKDEVVTQELKEEDGGKDRKFISGFYEAFRKYLISGLSKEDFADLYSQTITYGLFAARTRSENGFNRKLAYSNIPPTIGILRDVFEFISLGTLPNQMEWIIDDISEVLALTDVKKILHQYFHEGKGKDPIVHFYETFLAEYDPKMREKRGVYYTPEPVVSYIVRSLNIILKEKFGKADGFASSSVTILDPAAGTLTFPAEAAKLAVEEFVSKYGEGGKENFIKEYVLKNFYAFELMMAPYAIGHLKISFLLEELGYKLQTDDRFKLYLTNTLEMEELEQTDLPGMASLSEESHLAGRVKKDQPILVIMGNPPYSVSSANKSDFIEKEMALYKEDVRSERNIQPLSDDYIKFIRFAHWKIEKSGAGVIGMITNNSYLSGLIHRGMRKKLLGSFNEIYILNLHGNSRIGEKCPDGSPDENVFDIQQGVSIALFIKSKQEQKLAKVFYEDVWGLWESKYDHLSSTNITVTRWNDLKPSDPYYFLIPKDFDNEYEYERFFTISYIFNSRSFGVTTARDSLVVGYLKEEIINKLRILTGNLTDDLIKKSLSLHDTITWNLSNVLETLKSRFPELTERIFPYAYRPFDSRWICYDSSLIERDRKEIMQHVLNKGNVGLNLTRRLRDTEWKHVYTSCLVTDKTLLSSRDNCYFFPLYLYPDTEKKDLFNHKQKDEERKPNFNPEFYKTVSETYAKELSPEEIFYYIYGVLYSNTYRTKYAEFLKIDFPRVPFTKSYKVFGKVAELGEKLVNLHLLKSNELDNPIAKFQGNGDEKVDKPVYKDGRVYISKTQYFDGVEEDVWEYQIGGYQVCNKWLKDRKGRRLLTDDIIHYCKVVTALKKTIAIQEEIDNIYDEVEKDLIEFNS